MSKASRRRQARARRKGEADRPAPPPEVTDEGAEEAGGAPSPPRGFMGNQGPGPTDAPSVGEETIQDPVLKRAEAEIERRLLPDNRRDYMRVVVAGMKMGMAGGRRSLIARLGESKMPPLQEIAYGAVNVGLILFKESRYTMPVKALIPAAMTLMIKTMDFAEKSGHLPKVTPQMVDEATKIFMNYVLHRFNVPQAKLEYMARQVHSVVQDPHQVDILNRRAGLTRDPRLSGPGVPPAVKVGG